MLSSKRNYSFRRLALLAATTVLLLIMAFVCIVQLFYGITRQQAILFNQSILQNNADAEKRLTASVKDIFNSASFDTSLFELIHYDYVSPQALLSGLKQLDTYLDNAYFIDSIYIYNCENQSIYVSSPNATEAVWTLNSFYDPGALELIDSYMNYENMEPIFRDITVSYPKLEQIHLVSFLRYDTLSQPNKSSVLIINIRQDIFFEQMKVLTEDTGSHLFLVHRDGSYLPVNSPFDQLPEAILSKMGSLFSSHSLSSGYYLSEDASANNIICYQPVFEKDWLLISITDQNQMSHLMDIKSYLLELVIFLLLFAILCIALINVFRRLSSLHRQNQQQLALAQQEKRQKEYAQNKLDILNFLHSVNIQAPDLLSETEDALIVVIAIDHYSQLALRYDSPDGLPIVKYSILNIAEELLNYSGVVISAYEDDYRCVCLLQPVPDEHSLLDKLSALQDKLTSLLQISISCVISSPVPVKQLPSNYEYLCNSIPYKQLFGPCCIITPDMLEARELSDSIITENQLRAFTQAVLELKMDTALLFLQEMLDLMSKGSYKNFQLGLMQIVTNLDRALNMLQSNHLIEKKLYSGIIIYNLSSFESANDIIIAFSEILYQVKDTILQIQDGKQQDLLNKIKSIVQENYGDHDFSINTVAEKIGMSASYLSRLFKKGTGTTFVEYVLSVRMNAACTLLEENVLTIDQIVASIGFNDTPYFYKVFKRVNGCTPSVYRSTHKKQS